MDATFGRSMPRLVDAIFFQNMSFGRATVIRSGRRGVRVSSQSSVAGVDYRYELRRGDEVLATGHLSRELPLEVGDRIEIGGQPGIVRAIEPLLGERELRLVVQLVRDHG
jgi:hypothetical protein